MDLTPRAVVINTPSVAQQHDVPALRDFDHPFQFLIIGHGNLSSDVVTKISQAVASWEMPNVSMKVSSTLGTDYVQLLTAVDYAFFLTACDQQYCRPQIVPVCPQPQNGPELHSPKENKKALSQDKLTQVIGTKPIAQKTVLNDAHSSGFTSYSPGQLLHQAQARCNRHIQAWALNIPATLDTIAAASHPRIDQAMDAIAVFLRCYAAPL